MASPRYAQDGQVAFGVIINGSGIITIARTGLIYKVNNFKPTRNATTAEQLNPDGTPGQWRAVESFDTLTAEIQCQSGNTVNNYPQFGDTFTANSDANYGTETWSIMPVAPEQNQAPGTIRVIPITARKVYNGLTNYSTTA